MAVRAGPIYGFNPTSSITFTLDAPDGKTSLDTEQVTGNGSYGTPTGYLPSTAGTYHCLATYSGSTNNRGATSTFSAGAEVAVGPGATVVGHDLYLVGGNGNDTIQVQPAGRSSTGSTGITLTATLNGSAVPRSYAQAFTTLHIVGFGGNDTVKLASTLTIAADVSEGNGTDTIQVGDGNNLIVAGLGQHTVTAGNGNNILIDGSVQLTQAGDSLAQVLSDWIQLGGTAANVANLRARLAVTDNSANANVLTAGNGLDWFWATFAPDTTNPKATDLVN